MDRNIHPGIATEIDRLDEAVDKARAAFESASEIDALVRMIGEKCKVGPKVAMNAALVVTTAQLGAARVVLNSARLRLAGRLAAPRLTMRMVYDAPSDTRPAGSQAGSMRPPPPLP